MLALRCAPSLLLFYCVPFASAQTPHDVKKPEEPKELAEVRFIDESVVRMCILQERLEIATKYGKLVVPTSDILKVDFGVHVPSELESKIAKAIEELGSEVYKVRETAMRDLLSWGPSAYPQLYRSSKSNQLEVKQRVGAVLDRLKAKYPVDNLRLRSEDIIVTQNFTIVGQIVTPTVKAQAENFGDLDLKLAKLRGIRWLAKQHETELTIDLLKNGLPGQWLDSGYEVHQGMRLHIVASGTVNLLPQNPGFVCGPKGLNANQGFGGQMAPGLPYAPGTLLGRIGQDGSMFVIGDHYEGAATREGKLYLHIAPSPWQQNGSNGSYHVKIGTKSDFGGD
jgi:hypothetical protein